MKKLLSLLPALALMTATVGALATAPHKFAKKWFVYSGTGDPGLNSNYSLAPSNGADPGCPTPPTTVCAVQADPSSGNSNRPDQTELTTIDGASSGFTTSRQPRIPFKVAGTGNGMYRRLSQKYGAAFFSHM